MHPHGAWQADASLVIVQPAVARVATATHSASAAHGATQSRVVQSASHLVQAAAKDFNVPAEKTRIAVIQNRTGRAGDNLLGRSTSFARGDVPEDPLLHTLNKSLGSADQQCKHNILAKRECHE